jgi:exodeoxyribonuclease VIII
MRLGTAVHSALLEPDEFAKIYDVTDLRKNTKAYKEMLSENPRKIYLNNSDWRSIQEIKRRFAQNREATELLEFCSKRETEVKREIQGVPFRGFVDAMSKDVIIDIKTTQDASEEGFSKSVYNFSYHLQAAIYKELTGASEFYIIAVENTAPHNICIYRLSQDALDSGYSMMSKGIDSFKNWNGEETGYVNDGILNLPRWAK